MLDRRKVRISALLEPVAIKMIQTGITIEDWIEKREGKRKKKKAKNGPVRDRTRRK